MNLLSLLFTLFALAVPVGILACITPLLNNASSGN